MLFSYLHFLAQNMYQKIYKKLDVDYLGTQKNLTLKMSLNFYV